MDQPASCAPILFLVFNRPEQTQRVFERIRSIRPPRLYVAADGPRPSRSDDEHRCRQVRAIVSDVDWSCETFTLYRDSNLGCALAVSRALDWFFSSEKEGIVVEDDCLPDPSFFKFCTQMLARYRHNTRIGQICGFNLLPESSPQESDYFCSHFGWSWGWASWSRVWSDYDLKMSGWSRFKAQGLHHQYPFYPERVRLFDETSQAAWRESWDYQWHYRLAAEGLLSLIPRNSLIENIGFTKDATHTSRSDALRSRQASSLDFRHQLRHPEFLMPDPIYEKRLIRAAHKGSWKAWLRRLAKKILSSFPWAAR